MVIVLCLVMEMGRMRLLLLLGGGNLFLGGFVGLGG